MELCVEAYYVTVLRSESAAIERLVRHLTVFFKDQQEALRRYREKLGFKKWSLALRAPRFRRVAE
jgi:hypothetical protein